MVEVDGGPAVVEHEIQGNGDSAMSPCAEEPANDWYFSAGGTARGSAQALELLNPFGDDAIVDIAFLTEGGVQEPQALQGFVVGRRARSSSRSRTSCPARSASPPSCAPGRVVSWPSRSERSTGPTAARG